MLISFFLSSFSEVWHFKLYRTNNHGIDCKSNSIDWTFEINETSGKAYTEIDQFDGFKFHAWIYENDSRKIGTISVTLLCGDVLDVHRERKDHAFQKQYWVCSKHNIHINYGSAGLTKEKKINKMLLIKFQFNK